MPPSGSELPPRPFPGFLPKALQPSRPIGADRPAGCVQAAQLLSCPPTPSPPPLSLASLPQLYGWHMEAISICPQHQDAAARCAPASGILRVPAGPFQRLHAKQPAVCGERLGRYISVEAAWPSVHMGHPGLLESQRWKAVRVLPESGWWFCVLVLSVPSLCSRITLCPCPWARGQALGREFRGRDHTDL